MSAALDQRDIKHVPDEKLAKAASIDRDVNSPKGKSDSNGVDSSSAASRDGTPVDQRRRSPSTETKKAAAALVQMHNAATPPISKHNSDSPKSKPSTPVSAKRNESVDEMTDKFDSLSTSSPKQQQKNIISNRDDALTCNTKPRGIGFRTDRDYLNDHDEDNAEELEAWEPDPEHPYEQDEVQHSRGKGWSADEMFRANKNLGVNSSYNGINEYCTAMPEGDEEARRRADQIAYEIERNKDSQRAALLENDDNEQDLDKETRFDDREGGSRGQKRSSGGSYQNKDNRRSQFNSGGSGVSSGGRNYTNAPRNSFPNTGSSGQNSGSNRYGNTGNNSQPRQQQPRGSYSSSYSSASNAPNRQPAPTSTSWRTDSPQQTGQQQSGNNYANKPTAKSPTLHSEERRQSASPATSKYSTDSNNTNTSVRRTNSVQNRQQQPDYSSKPEGYQQTDRRVPDNQYHDGSSSSSSIPPQTASPQGHPQVEIQPLITPIPKQAPTPQGQYDNNQQQYGNSPHQQQTSNEDSKKKFTFNPDAAVFVPKAPSQSKTTPTPVLTPSSMSMQSGIPQQQPQQMPLMANQHQMAPQQIPGMANFPYNGQMLQASMVGMQQNQMIYQMPVQQQRAYQPVEASYVDNGKIMEAQQQQKYMAQMRQQGAQIPPLQYVQQPQYSTQHSQMIPQQLIPHPQLTGQQVPYAANPTAALPYQHAPPVIQPPQQILYQYGYTNGQ